MVEEIFLGHVRLDREMKSLPKGEHFWHAVRHNLLPPIAKMHATRSSEGFSVIYPRPYPQEDIRRTFKTEAEMQGFLKKIGATLYMPKAQESEVSSES